MTDRPRQHGFVLVLTLLLVVLAGVTLAGIAHRSGAGALEARARTEELQRRWAVVSCRRALLPQAEKLLDEAERGPQGEEDEADHAGGPAVYENEPMVERRVTCELAGLDYEFVVTDEQAKVNVNHLLSERGPARTRSALGRLVEDFSGPRTGRPKVRLRTLVGEPYTSEETVSPVGGYGQILETTHPRDLAGRSASPGVVAAITCWGDGTINLRRAPAKVIELACEPTLGPRVVGAIIEARDRNPYRKLDAILAEMACAGVDPEPSEVKKVVRTRSACHGLWVIARTPRRSYYTLSIQAPGEREQQNPVGGARYDFEW